MRCRISNRSLGQTRTFETLVRILYYCTVGPYFFTSHLKFRVLKRRETSASLNGKEIQGRKFKVDIAAVLATDSLHARVCFWFSSYEMILSSYLELWADPRKIKKNCFCLHETNGIRSHLGRGKLSRWNSK